MRSGLRAGGAHATSRRTSRTGSARRHPSAMAGSAARRAAFESQTLSPSSAHPQGRPLASNRKSRRGEAEASPSPGEIRDSHGQERSQVGSATCGLRPRFSESLGQRFLCQSREADWAAQLVISPAGSSPTNWRSGLRVGRDDWLPAPISVARPILELPTGSGISGREHQIRPQGHIGARSMQHSF